jgi:hypothetical protein
MATNNVTLNNSKRSSRAASTRDTTVRAKSWTPPTLLEAPKAPEGWKYRWIRAEMLGQEDKVNMSKRLREGYELVKAEDHPEFSAPTITDGTPLNGCIGTGGLVLAKFPLEFVEQRNAYYSSRADDQLAGVDNDMMRESNASMPLSSPERKSTTTFGSQS